MKKLIKNSRKTIKSVQKHLIVEKYDNNRCSFRYGGRLGNNMFQIANCISYSKRHGLKALIPHFGTYIYDDVKYEYDFDKIFENKIPLSKIYENSFDKYIEPEFHYIEIPAMKNVLLLGNFQSEKYFDKLIIKKVFEFKKENIIKLINRYGSLLNRSVAVHIRRTDYLNNPLYHHVQDFDYYQKCFDFFGSNYNFLIFSDDMNWCKDNFKGNNFFFIKNEEDYLDMILMSMCNHNIISNSSFSWWPAWLNNHTDKKVYAPQKWFGSNCSHNSKDVYAKGWNII